MSLGNNLKALRKQRGLSQYDVAASLGIKRGRYNSWENDIAKPRYEMLEKLCSFYKVPMNDLTGLENKDSDEFDHRTRAIARNFQEMDSSQKKLLEDLIKSMKRTDDESDSR